MNCLDAGCGGGDVTRLLAQWVGPHGYVLGLDMDAEIVRLAEADVRAAELDQVTFRVGNVYDLQPEPIFDRVYARFLLTHLPEPLGGLHKLVRMLKPGGLVVVEDIEVSGGICYPPAAVFEQGAALYCATVQRKGGDPDIGPKLPALLRLAGLQEIGVNIVQPAFLSGPCKAIWSLTLKRIAKVAEAEDLVSSSEFTSLIEQIADFEARPDSFISMPRIFQVWGTRR